MKFEYDGKVFTGTPIEIKSNLKRYMRSCTLCIATDGLAVLGSEFAGFLNEKHQDIRDKLTQRALNKIPGIEYNGMYFKDNKELREYLSKQELKYKDGKFILCSEYYCIDIVKIKQELINKISVRL